MSLSIMVVLNDVGLTLEIVGFALFIFVPLQETWNLSLETGKNPSIIKRISNFMNDHNKTRYVLRYGGIGMIITGLIMQYSFLNQTI